MERCGIVRRKNARKSFSVGKFMRLYAWSPTQIKQFPQKKPHSLVARRNEFFKWSRKCHQKIASTVDSTYTQRSIKENQNCVRHEIFSQIFSLKDYINTFSALFCTTVSLPLPRKSFTEKKRLYVKERKNRESNTEITFYSSLINSIVLSRSDAVASDRNEITFSKKSEAHRAQNL